MAKLAEVPFNQIEGGVFSAVALILAIIFAYHVIKEHVCSKECPLCRRKISAMDYAHHIDLRASAPHLSHALPQQRLLPR